ncbi:MAG: hypothetical protein QXY05_01805 [Candidatus Anstonellales archaeon]
MDEVFININGNDGSEEINEKAIRNFVRALDVNVKTKLLRIFQMKKNPSKFNLWIRILTEEIQKTSTEGVFPLTEQDIVRLFLNLIYAYEKLPENEKEIVWKMLESEEMKLTLKKMDLNIVKIVALNKAVNDVESADGAVELLDIMLNKWEDKKYLVFAGLNYILSTGKGNPEAAFRLLKLITSESKIDEKEKQTISKFLSILDPDFLLIKIGEIKNEELKKLIVERLLSAASEFGWKPKDERIVKVFEKHGLSKK